MSAAETAVGPAATLSMAAGPQILMRQRPPGWPGVGVVFGVVLGVVFGAGVL